MEDRKAFLIGCALGGLLLLCIGCLLFMGGSAWFVRQAAVQISTPETPTNTPIIVRPTSPATEQAVDLTDAEQNLFTLTRTEVPENNASDLAQRLLGISAIPETFPDPLAPYAVGAEKQFWIINTGTNQSFQITAVLRYERENVYFWVEQSVSYDQAELERLVDEFQDHIYSTTREFFGSEWSPGIDEDPHIYILFTPGIGFGTAGYFSSIDSLHPLAHEYSNAHEMFVFNSDNTSLSSSYTLGVLAHEFQHMIHSHVDLNESAWINEGLSEVSALINGYYTGGFDSLFLSDPDLQLNTWPNNNNTAAHYGASFLFLTYFMDRMGPDLTQAVVRNEENGLKSIDAVLQEAGVTDPLSGQPVTADKLVQDWALANYLQNGSIGDGRYTYHNFPSAPQAFETEAIRECTGAPQVRDVHQYGTDYIRITCAAGDTIHFEGSYYVDLLSENAYSGDYFFWSNYGDQSDMRLTRSFDLTSEKGPVSFSYRTWYDIEEDYDYVYLGVSTDGGDSWQILITPGGTGSDPTGNSYGWGYNGESGGWIQQTVDLSDYAGLEILLRFEYVTDAAVNGEGFMLDDLSIPEIGYFSDLEVDDGGWTGEGFVRISNVLPQTFELAIIRYGEGGPVVEKLTLNADNALDIKVGDDETEVVLVVNGTTRFTHQVATYQFWFK